MDETGIKLSADTSIPSSTLSIARAVTISRLELSGSRKSAEGKIITRIKQKTTKIGLSII